MKIRNLSIGTRLSIGFSIILLLILLLGTWSFRQSQRLWLITDALYNHSYHVSNASRDIMISINEIHLLHKDIALDTKLSQQEIENNIARINQHEVEAINSFKALYANYLGSKEDINKAYALFKNWKPMRDSLIKLRLRGNYDSVYSTYKINNARYREMLFKHLKVMVDFSTQKAANFYEEAKAKKNEILFWWWTALVVVVLLSVLCTYLIFKSINTPLSALTKTTEKYRQGDYSARSNYISTNEIGLLASSFNSLAASVQMEINMNEQVTAIAKLIINENELRPFCKVLLKALNDTVNSQIAAIYLFNEEKTGFNHFESIGMLAENCKPVFANSAEGEFGAALVQKKIVHISDIPDDTVFMFPTTTGQFRPREMITIPIMRDNSIIAIISLSSLYNFTASAIKLLNELHFVITSRLTGVLAFQETTDISRKLDIQNQDLSEKSRELAMQADELKEYNIELKMQKKQVEEADRFKSAFLSNMSHELRTPLNSVIALSGVLTRKLSGQISEDEYNYLGIIEKNGKQLLLLINNILDLSRVEAGKEEITISKFTINSLIESLVESLNPLAAEKNLKIETTKDPYNTVIESDNDKCHHILQNIISNAIKFTEEGSIEISAEPGNNEIHIKVRDTGIGIDPEYVPLVFDEFRQADDKASRKYGGTGLGLAIAKKYALLLGGNISLVSQPGIGTTFTIVLPLRLGSLVIKNFDPEPAAEPIAEKPQVTSIKDEHSAKGKTILLVEDSEPQVLQLSYILTKSGYIVEKARHGKQALDFLEKSIPDAMILDLMMPGVDGFKVLEVVRSKPETSRIPVLILTAKHVTKNEMFFLKGNHIHEIILKGVVNRVELLSHVDNMIKQVQKPALEPVKRRNPRGGKPIVLIIEDNPDNMQTAIALLSEIYEVTGCNTAEKGLLQARELLPDVILTDISLPGMDGFGLFDELRKDEHLRHIPVVALTARAMTGDRDELLAYGFDGYISKPIDNETMTSTMEKLLASNLEMNSMQ